LRAKEGRSQVFPDGADMTEILQPPAPPPPPLRWYQYRLRSLLIFTTLTAVFFSVARMLGFVDAVICLAAFLVLVAFLRFPRRVHPVTAVVLALIAGTLLWANLRPAGWQKEFNVMAPDELDPITRAMFWRGCPLCPFMVCPYRHMTLCSSGLEWMPLVLDGLLFVAALFAARRACDWFFRKRGKPMTETSPNAP
jgi:hypothetical protein